MNLTKTDFIQYLNCPNSLWLLKNKPETYDNHKSEFSLFLKRLIREGYEVETYVEKLFSNSKDIGNLDKKETKDLLSKETGKFLQATFQAENGAFARVDVLEVHKDKSVSIYEIKSSTSIKTDAKHNHLKDIAFQKYVLEKSGYEVKNLYIVHLNKNFVKNGKIDESELLEIVLVDDLVSEIFDRTVLEIDTAIDLINRKEINENLCSCLDKSKSNHCDSFKYFNKNIPENSIYLLNNIRAQKIIKLRDMGVEKISNIPDDFKLSEHQLLHRESILAKKPIIDKEKIKETLDSLKFPLYFFDYETLPSAIPKVDGYRPHQHLPTQYSLHVLEKNGKIEHFEYLAEKLEKPKKLIQEIQKQIQKNGTLVSWKKSYEQMINREMAEIYPEYAIFLHEINNRTFDLMDIFKVDYVDSMFNGSKSIKDIQPVLVPSLSYKDLDVQSGTMAVDIAEKLFKENDTMKQKEMKDFLFKYCELDTLSMVEIYKKLKMLE